MPVFYSSTCDITQIVANQLPCHQCPPFIKPVPSLLYILHTLLPSSVQEIPSFYVFTIHCPLPSIHTHPFFVQRQIGCMVQFFVSSLTAVPMDDKGIIPEELEKLIEAHKDYRPRELTEKKPYWSLLYALTTFHNPRGMCLPPGGSAQ